MTPGDFVPKDRGQIRITLGDRDANGKSDVTVEVFGRLPLATSPDPMRLLNLGPFNLPIDEVLTLAQSASAALPQPVATVLGIVIGVMRLLFH